MAAIIILGGHRSGTSITARIVHELGFPAAATPERLLTPRPGRESDNPDGYYEDIAFVRLHRRMLGEQNRSLGGWRNPRRDDAEIHRLEGRYRTLIRERSLSGDWSLKDPRLCLLSDVYFDAAAGLEIPMRVVATVRPIAETIASLQRRGLSGQDASRIAEQFEAGRLAAVESARRRGLPVVETSLGSVRSRSDAEEQVWRLQEFLGMADAQRTARLAALVRVRGECAGNARTGDSLSFHS